MRRTINSGFPILFIGILLSCTNGKKGDSSMALAAILGNQPSASRQQVVSRYADLAYESYNKNYQDLTVLQTAVNTFVTTPSAANLIAAKSAWIKARASYLLTEAFRFAGGPIDVASISSISWQGCGAGTNYVGDTTYACESLINSWPLDEIAIDNYVQGGNNTTSFASILARNGDISIGSPGNTDDTTIILTGWHAIEYLLWGQDNSGSPQTYNQVAGLADYTCFTGSPTTCNSNGQGGNNGGTGSNRGNYLKTVTDALVGHLKLVRDAWGTSSAPGPYRQAFLADPNASLTQVFRGLGKFIAGEWGGDRLKGIYAHDQEDEHSCFSDNTKSDFYYDAQSVLNLWSGSYTLVKNNPSSTGPGLSALLGILGQGNINAEITQARDTFCVNNVESIADPNYTSACPSGSITGRYDQIIMNGFNGFPGSQSPDYQTLQNAQVLIGDRLKKDFVTAATALGITITDFTNK
ncbi:imelysin [Leptospira fainei serovar Hurstbridge str. BUT 6]|uniref:Imelysin n=1 Tax=Leptospira fainei serovar Hurstbridge str. BUT 6 TaxID=1193011 RepID=S3W1D4_9LEPT|nr:imelysin family protein [Leptospira fainei]EPG74102.1 imelysin [Leptospira fainei serovar Hurstbridge str. BUT 6]